MTKRYISLTGTQYTFPVKVAPDGRIEWVSFLGHTDAFVTSDAQVQKAIEASQKFLAGEIGCADAGDNPSKAAADAPPADKKKEYPDVASLNEAVTVLSAEPYNVSRNALRTPEAIEKKAAEKGVVFPNLFGDEH
jgi:hypothetical protein